VPASQGRTEVRRASCGAARAGGASLPKLYLLGRDAAGGVRFVLDASGAGDVLTGHLAAAGMEVRGPWRAPPVTCGCLCGAFHPDYRVYQGTRAQRPPDGQLARTMGAAHAGANGQRCAHRSSPAAHAGAQARPAALAAPRTASHALCRRALAALGAGRDTMHADALTARLCSARCSRPAHRGRVGRAERGDVAGALMPAGLRAARADAGAGGDRAGGGGPRGGALAVACGAPAARAPPHIQVAKLRPGGDRLNLLFSLPHARRAGPATLRTSRCECVAGGLGHGCNGLSALG